MGLPFITAYDPVSGSSGSLDPLGTLQSYGALANLLLPGVSTITTRARYLSFLCWALHNAEQHRTFPPGPAGLQLRRRAVEPAERLWALGCVRAEELNPEAKAAIQLRGITYAKSALRRFQQQGRSISLDYDLLKYQGRTGAVGTYWVTLVGGELIDEAQGALTQEGVELAGRFWESAPLPLTSKQLCELADPSEALQVKLSLAKLTQWAEISHLGVIGKDEQKLLKQALRNHERRDQVAQALAKLDQRDRLPGTTWSLKDLVRLKSSLKLASRAVQIGLPEVVGAIIMLEKYYGAVLAAFNLLLWWGTEEADVTVSKLFTSAEFRALSKDIQESAEALLNFQSGCSRPEIKIN